MQSFSHNFKLGDKVYVAIDMSFMGRPPSLIRVAKVARVSAVSVWVEGRVWSDGSGRRNPDQRYRVKSPNVARITDTDSVLIRY